VSPVRPVRPVRPVSPVRPVRPVSPESLAVKKLSGSLHSHVYGYPKIPETGRFHKLDAHQPPLDI
jgi:hypothetical protein